MKALPAVVAGIVVSDICNAALWPMAVVATAMAIGAVLCCRKHDTAASLFVYGMLFFAAASMTSATRTRGVLPCGEKVVMSLGITDMPEVSGRWSRATAYVDEFRMAEGDGTWKRSGEKVVARFDTAFHVAAGQRLIVTGYASALGSEEYAGYVRLMQRRGYSRSVWVDDTQNIVVLPERKVTPRIVASRWQAEAARRLERLGLSEEAYATAAAMSIGARSSFPDTLRDDYNATGAAHLLAVSGLHVGMVAMLVNILLWPLPALRRGHILKNCVAVAAIWGYAMLSGLSPSVVRAAIMFTGAQLAFAASRTGNGTNIFFAAATLMLLINPDYLFDVSFQLSFAAVAGILMLYKPLYGLVKSRYKWLNAFWTLFMVGLAASLATAPLVSYYFGRIPVVGVIINPLLIIVANVTVLLSLLWIMIPIPFMSGVFSKVIGASAWFQNELIAVSAGKWWASVPVRMEMWQVLALYAAVLCIYAILRSRKSERCEPKKVLS